MEPVLQYPEVSMALKKLIGRFFTMKYKVHRKIVSPDMSSIYRHILLKQTKSPT